MWKSVVFPDAHTGGRVCFFFTWNNKRFVNDFLIKQTNMQGVTAMSLDFWIFSELVSESELLTVNKCFANYTQMHSETNTADWIIRCSSIIITDLSVIITENGCKLNPLGRICSLWRSHKLAPCSKTGSSLHKVNKPNRQTSRRFCVIRLSPEAV